MPLGEWFSASTQVGKNHLPSTPAAGNWDEFHRNALRKLNMINVERGEVMSLNDQIAKVKHDTEEKIMKINKDLLTKIQNLSEVRDVEVAELQEKADDLTAHIKKSSHAGPPVIAAPLNEKYAVKLNM
jgi:Co/Zn/Cd efflux system component